MAEQINIEAGIRLKGEGEYKSAITNINNITRSLKSEMTLVTAQYEGQANSIEALKAKQEVLNKILDAQKQKVEATNNGLSHARETYNNVGTGLEALKNKYHTAKQKMEEMEKSTGTTTKELEEQKKEVEKLASAVQKGEKNYETAGNRVQKWQDDLNRAETQVIRTNREIEKNTGYIQEAEKSTNSCATSINEYGREIKQAGESADKAGEQTKESIETMAAALAAAGVAAGAKKIADALYECVEAAESLEYSVAQLDTIADSSVSLKSLEDDALALSSATGEAADMLTKTAYDAISAGQDTADAFEFVKTSNKLATAGFAETAQTVDLLSTILNAYGMEAENVTNISDMLINTQNKGKISVAEMAANMGKAIPTANANSVALEQLCAAYEKTTAKGIRAAESTTYINSMMNELGKTGSVIDKFLRENMGGNFKELMEQGYSLAEVLKMIEDGAEETGLTLGDMFGNAQAGKAAIIILSDGVESFNESVQGMIESAGATETAYGKMAEISEFAKNKILNSFQLLKIAIGKELAPTLKELYKAGDKALTVAADFIKRNPWIVSAVTGLTAALGTLAVGISAVMIVKKATELMKVFNLVLAANPAILVATAIIGVTTALIAFTNSSGRAKSETKVLSEESKKLRESMDELSDSVIQNRKAREDNTDSIHAEWAACQMISDELFELQDIENKSNEEKTRMQTLINQLNKSIPNLNLAIDEQTGMLNTNKESVNQSIEALEKYYLVQAAEEHIKEILKEKAEAMIAVEKAESNLIEVENKAKEAHEEYNKQLTETNTSLNEYGQAMGAYGNYYNGYSQSVLNCSKATKEYKKTIESGNETIAELNNEYEDYMKLLNDYKSSTDEATQANEKFNNSLNSGDIIENTSEIAESFEKMKDSIAESVRSSISLFDEFNGGTEITTTEIISNLDSQITGLEKWASNMQILAQKGGQGMTQEFYKYLTELGPQGANLVNSLVQSLESQDGKFEEVCNKWMQGIDLEGSLSETLADGYKATVSGVDDIVDAAEKGAEQVNNAMHTMGEGDVYKTLTRAFQDASSQIEAVGSGFSSTTRIRFMEAVETAKQCGVELPKELAIGLQNGSKSPEQAISQINSLIKQKQEEAKPQARATGESIPSNISDGINSTKGITVTAAGAVMDESAAIARGKTSQFDAIGGNISQGLANGINSSLGKVASAAASAVQGAIDAAKNKAGIQSPSRVFKNEIGLMLTKGMSLGIKDGEGKAISSITDTCKKVFNAATTELDIHSPSKKFRNEIGAQISHGIAQGINDKKKNAKNMMDDLAKELTNKKINWIPNNSKSLKENLENEKRYWQEVKKTLKKGTKEYEEASRKINNLNLSIKVINKGNFGVSEKDNKGAVKSASKHSREVLEAATSWFGNYKQQHKTTINDEVVFWNQIRKQLKKGTGAYREATQNLNAAKESVAAAKKSAAQEKLSASDTALSQFKTYYQVSVKGEVKYWDIVRKQFKKGTAERIEADQKYYEAKANLNEQLESLNKDYVDNCKQVNDKLKEDVQNLKDAYKDAVKDRKETIYNSFGLFDQFKSESESGAVLLHNLKTQVAGYADWELQLEKLASRGLPTGLMDELKAMGPEASASMHALNELTDKELKEYTKLWQQKNDLSESQAAKELEPMRKETVKQINQLTSEAKKELKTLKTDYNKAVKELNTDISSALKKVAKSTKKTGEDASAQLIAGIKNGAKKKSATAELKKAQTSIEKGLSGLPKAGKTIGADTLIGITSGINNKAIITKTANDFINQLKKEMQKAADIHSPSRLFKKEIGLMIPAGIGEGIKEGTTEAAKAGDTMLSQLIEQSKEKMKEQQNALTNYCESLEDGIKIDALNNLTQTEKALQTNSAMDIQNLTSMLQDMLNIMQEHLPKTGNMQMVTDTGALIGETQQGMSTAFAMMQRRTRL